MDKRQVFCSSLGQEADRAWDGSSISEAHSDSLRSSSSVFSDDSYQPISGEDCAELLLACLHCRFHELTHLLVDTFNRAVGHLFPSMSHIAASNENDHYGWECWTCNLELDWDCCGPCQDTAELLELAMEVSEVCYR
ncbi:myoD family inhibitor domain-containing protein 2 [Corythoichthys intestinalis]|uniref:myoD family inhibitor domain-containing protein 2 n=1 Tax=Corythoichthys intestinalis TaxID=161448 RepID=UPI0025A67721|nr:myoD family inhibitor domain-containing protein 2 [Corythoichthys intestinalis]